MSVRSYVGFYVNFVLEYSGPLDHRGPDVVRKFQKRLLDQDLGDWSYR